MFHRPYFKQTSTAYKILNTLEARYVRYAEMHMNELVTLNNDDSIICDFSRYQHIIESYTTLLKHMEDALRLVMYERYSFYQKCSPADKKIFQREVAEKLFQMDLLSPIIKSEQRYPRRGSELYNTRYSVIGFRVQNWTLVSQACRTAVHEVMHSDYFIEKFSPDLTWSVLDIQQAPIRFIRGIG